MPGEIVRAGVRAKNAHSNHCRPFVGVCRVGIIVFYVELSDGSLDWVAHRIELIDCLLADFMTGGGGRLGFLAVITIDNVIRGIVIGLVTVVDVFELVVVYDFHALVRIARQALIFGSLIPREPVRLVGVPVQGDLDVFAIPRIIVCELLRGAIVFERF